MLDPVHAQPRGKFETLLETLDEADVPPVGKDPGADAKTGPMTGAVTGAMTGLGRLWPRASAAPPPQFYVQGGQLERLYEIERLFAETQQAADAPKSPPKDSQAPAEARPPTDLIALIARASGRLNLDELRGLRRQCALALHPDRAPPAEREQAQQLMAEANAAIDRAMAELARSPRQT